MLRYPKHVGRGRAALVALTGCALLIGAGLDDSAQAAAGAHLTPPTARAGSSAPGSAPNSADWADFSAWLQQRATAGTFSEIGRAHV